MEEIPLILVPLNSLLLLPRTMMLNDDECSAASGIISKGNRSTPTKYA
jgi:hypothetical protein